MWNSGSADAQYLQPVKGIDRKPVTGVEDLTDYKGDAPALVFCPYTAEMYTKYCLIRHCRSIAQIWISSWSPAYHFWWLLKETEWKSRRY